MATATLVRDEMARPKGRPKTSDREDVSVKVDKEVVDMARHVAAQRGTSLADVLSEAAREKVTSQFLEVLRELEQKVARPQPRGKPAK